MGYYWKALYTETKGLVLINAKYIKSKKLVILYVKKNILKLRD